MSPTVTLARLVEELNDLHAKGRWATLDRDDDGVLHYIDAGPREDLPQPPIPEVERYAKRSVNKAFRSEMIAHIKRCRGEVDLMKGGPYTRTTWVHRRSAELLEKLVEFLDKD